MHSVSFENYFLHKKLRDSVGGDMSEKIIYEMTFIMTLSDS